MPGPGEAACLGAAALWAVSVSLYREPIREHGARTVNLAKCLAAAALQAATVLLLGGGGALAAAPGSALGALALSGVVGLTVGDTALFGAVGRLGAHRTLLLQTLAPVFAAALALLARGERPSPVQALGAGAILAGVALVVAPGREERGGWSAAGIALAVLAAFCQGAGVVLAQAGTASVPVLGASAVRLAAAAAGLLAWAAATGRLPRLGALARSPRAVRRVVPAMLLGTYLALFLMMAGVSRAPASVAAVLLATSPVFSLVLEAVVERRPVAAHAVLGTVLAVAGVALVAGE